MEPVKTRTPTLATKADIANLTRDIKLWIIGAALAIVCSVLVALVVISKLA